ncbi:MAG: type 2 periplasmic-binding domain-containing protein [Acidiferrobacterales bacterium]
MRQPLSAAIAIGTVSAHAEPLLKIGYSDWSGRVTWQVAIDKGRFNQTRVPVGFGWFDYSASMDASTAGKIDVDPMTGRDTLVTEAGGGKNVMIMLTGYTNGEDMFVAKPGVHSIKVLTGKKVPVEVSLVAHLPINDLKKPSMKQSDVTLVNVKANEMPQALASGDVLASGNEHNFHMDPETTGAARINELFSLGADV